MDLITYNYLSNRKNNCGWSRCSKDRGGGGGVGKKVGPFMLEEVKWIGWPFPVPSGSQRGGGRQSHWPPPTPAITSLHFSAQKRFPFPQAPLLDSLFCIISYQVCAWLNIAGNELNRRWNLTCMKNERVERQKNGGGKASLSWRLRPHHWWKYKWFYYMIDNK